jgi:hypothetical protein
MVSNREKKRSIKQGVEKLRSKAGWDPTSFKSKSSQEQLCELNQEQRTESIYDEESESKCSDCTRCRQETGDPTALCETHLTEAMGF